MTHQKKTDQSKKTADPTLAPGARPGGVADAASEVAGRAPDKRRDRLEAIELADERTQESATERARNVGAETPGDPGALLSQPLGEGNYLRDADGEEALPEQDGTRRKEQ